MTKKTKKEYTAKQLAEELAEAKRVIGPTVAANCRGIAMDANGIWHEYSTFAYNFAMKCWMPSTSREKCKEQYETGIQPEDSFIRIS